MHVVGSSDVVQFMGASIRTGPRGPSPGQGGNALFPRLDKGEAAGTGLWMGRPRAGLGHVPVCLPRPAVRPSVRAGRVAPTGSVWRGAGQGADGLLLLIRETKRAALDGKLPQDALSASSSGGFTRPNSCCFSLSSRRIFSRTLVTTAAVFPSVKWTPARMSRSRDSRNGTSSWGHGGRQIPAP